MKSYGAKKKSIKFGHRGGRKSGEAVLLFETPQGAWNALDMNGVTVGGRYLEIVLITERDYERFN